MAGYIVLCVFIAFIIGCFFSFLLGWTKGRKKEAEIFNEIERQREQNIKNAKRIAAEIKQEVSNEAEERKADLSNGSTCRDRFDNINNSLRNIPPH